MSLSIVTLSYGHTSELDLNYIGSKLDNSDREFKFKKNYYGYQILLRKKKLPPNYLTSTQHAERQTWGTLHVVIP